MQNIMNSNGEREKVLVKGEIIKIVEELSFGVIQTEDDDFLFFHIGSFTDKDIKIEDLKEGDLVMCEKQIQKSDGKKSAINCERIEIKSYLKDYFIENALTAPSDVEKFDQFCENAMEYSAEIAEADFLEEDKEKLLGEIDKTETVMQLKMLRPKLAIIASNYSGNKIITDFLKILDEIIKNIKPSPGNTEEMDNFKTFVEILFSYMKLA